ncbi:replication-relaxation family protein [Oscillochloris sp. ZM17-4]|uniref:replication-relaxation family protein n=1 Tax=Oscillochloris sp. ZM17-4 TaxID=2866714 RepID=UPI001C73D890|nr:replication-relaxation family protein [Oscillochloris sp. ZM17-4]MBX0330070.1 replication-relaxation family protein [Oscillochloris sp. ZM17-4]
MTSDPPDDGTAAFGMTIYPGVPPLEARQVALLRLLGRIELADRAIIAQTIYQGYGASTLKRDLLALYTHRLIWRAPAPPTLRALTPANHGSTGRVGGRRRHVYGLSHEGLALLDQLEVEPDPRSLAGLKARDARGRYPSPSTLGHDLQVAWWCASLLEGLRRLPWCHSVFCQCEFVVSERQRIDAMVVARFDLTTPRADMETLPWFDGTPLRPGQVERRWALELDTGTEALPVLLRKFVCYRDHHADGVYAQIFGGPLLLVLLVQTPRRAGQLATEFQAAWPDGWGLVSLPHAADHPAHGALWGQYRRLRDSQAQALLAGLPDDPAPLLTLAQWEAYLALAAAGHPPRRPPGEAAPPDGGPSGGAGAG